MVIGSDIDGTVLCYKQSVPPAVNYFLLRQWAGQQVSFVSNQGGIPFALAGLARQNSSIPYPTPERFVARLHALLSVCEELCVEVVNISVCVYHPKAEVYYRHSAFTQLAEKLSWLNETHIEWALYNDPRMRKPQPWMLQYAQWPLAVFYGDSDEDEQAAQAAKIPFVRVPRFGVE